MHINNQKKLISESGIDFCYICGKSLSMGLINKDHCPPSKIFNEKHRSNYPAILKVHAKCNAAYSVLDEKYAIIWSKLSGNLKYLRQYNKLNALKVDNMNGAIILKDIEFNLLYYRIIRFCHSIFYKSFIPDGTLAQVISPLVKLNKDLSLPQPEKTLHDKLVAHLIHGQITGRSDAMRAYSGKFKYACCWGKLDNDEDICIFGFDIYESRKLGVQNVFRPACFIGYYKMVRPDIARYVERPTLVYPNYMHEYPLGLQPAVDQN